MSRRRGRGQSRTGHPAVARAGLGTADGPALTPRALGRMLAACPSCQGGGSVQVGPGTRSLSSTRGPGLTVSPGLLHQVFWLIPPLWSHKV